MSGKIIVHVPIPDRMKHLPVDRRGYPVPVIVTWKNGKPLFSVNDIVKVARCIAEDRCTICGGKLFRGRWLVGGGMSALGLRGKFADAPAHDECTHYALKVCPYLAAPNWRTTIGTQVALQENIAALSLEDEIAVPDTTRPEAFVAIMATQVDIEQAGLTVFLCRPRPGHVRKVEVWRHGKQLFGDDLAEFRERARASLVGVDTGHRQDVWQMLGGA